jgi:hypothetical protein
MHGTLFAKTFLPYRVVKQDHAPVALDSVRYGMYKVRILEEFKLVGLTIDSMDDMVLPMLGKSGSNTQLLSVLED